MIENYFLAYANNSLRDNPGNLNNIFDELKWKGGIEEHFDWIHPPISNIYMLIKDFVGIDYTSDHDTLLLNKLKHNLKGYSFLFNGADLLGYTEKEALEWVKEYIFGFTVEQCEKDCPFYEFRKILFETMNLAAPNRLKCYECDQLYFVFILSEIIGGKEYSEINGFFDEFVDNYPEVKQTIWVEDNPPESPFQEKLLTFSLYSPLSYFLESKDFRTFLYTPAKYSLTEFLLHNDRRRIKYCDECKKFYVSKTIRSSRFCSDKCRLAWHNRKYIESGKAKEAKKKGRKEGKYQ